MPTPQEKVNKIFVKAASRGDIRTMEVALKAGAELEGRGGFWELKTTALNNAALIGNEAVTRYLIDKGAKVDGADADGVTPLSYAVSGGHRAVAGILLAAGASLAARDKSGRTPLDEALRRKDPIMQQMLLRYAAGAGEKPQAAAKAPDSAPPESTAPAPAPVEAPAAAGENPDIVVFTSTAGSRTLEDIFNFAALERTTLVSTNHGPVESTLRESFARLDGSPLLRAAFEEHRRRGGTARDVDVFGPRLPGARLETFKP